MRPQIELEIVRAQLLESPGTGNHKRQTRRLRKLPRSDCTSFKSIVHATSDNELTSKTL